MALIGALLPMMTPCAAKDLELASGKVLKDVRLLRRHEQSVSLAHSTGGGIFPLSEFTPEALNWIRQNEKYRTFTGKNVDTNTPSFELGLHIAERVSGYPSLRTLLGTRIDSLVDTNAVSIPATSPVLAAIRKRLLKDIYTTWQHREHFPEILAYLRSPLGQEMAQVSELLCGDRIKLAEDFLVANPEKVKAYREELAAKSKSTGLFHFHVKTILRDLDLELGADHDRLLKKHLTHKEILAFMEFKKTPAWREMEDLALRVERQIATITREHELFRPGPEGLEPSLADLVARFEAARIKAAYGVNVHYDMQKDMFFPPRWYARPMLVKGTQLPSFMTVLVLDLVEDFLRTYPQKLVRSNLSDIYLLNSLELYGKPYGGTYSEASIYASQGYNSKEHLNTMHHEFSSILLRNYDFPYKEWKKINDPNWKYPKNAMELLENPHAHRQTERMLSQGFLSLYATSSLENDINVMIEWITCDQERLKELAARHRRIHEKAELLKEFYRDVRAGKVPRTRPVYSGCLGHVIIQNVHRVPKTDNNDNIQRKEFRVGTGSK